MTEPRIKAFEDGRIFQKLEDQITALDREILYGIGKNSQSTRKDLREKLENVFTRYLALAQQYRIPSGEVQRMSTTYKKAMGEDA